MKRVAAAMLALAATTMTACSAGAPVPAAPVDRVLVISLPGVHWADVRSGQMPNLARFVRRSAVGDLATRIGRRPATPADAYLSVSAGSRALAPSLEPAAAFDADETYGQVPAGDVFRRRTDHRPTGIGYLSIGTAREENAASRYGGEIGLLGDLLAEAGVARAVIANADRPEPDEPIAVDRAAATALMDSDGLVPLGSVSRDLRLTDPRAPYGTRLDRRAMLQAFDGAWNGSRGQRVVLVETSDLARAHAYRDAAAPAQYNRLRSSALADSDTLIAEVLSRVDLRRDAVVVISPVAPPGAPALGVVAVRTPTIDGGLVRSATTRRDGYVQLADVTPTLLSLVGADPPTDIEGRSFRVGRGRDDNDGHIDALATAVADARFRDDIVAVVVLSFVAVLVLMTAAFMFRARLPAIARQGLRPVALAILGAIPGTYVAGGVGFLSGNLGAYAVFVVAFGAVVAAVASAVDRRWPGTALIVALGGVIAVVGGDVARGAPLQLNTVFGYSVAVAGRFAGVGNLAYALLAPSALLFAVAVSSRFGRRGTQLAITVLAAVVLLDGLPFFGADVGGVLSMVPAFTVCALSLLGRSVRWQTVVGAFALAVVTVLTFAFFDLARPPAARTHLARIAEHVVDLRWGPIGNSVARRWQASFGTPSLAAWAALGIVILAVAAYLVIVDRRRRGDTFEGDRAIRASVPGLVLLAGLGLLANDSSFAVPGAMLIVVAPAAVLHLVRPPTESTTVL